MAGILVASSSLSPSRVLCTSHSYGFYKEEEMESARNSTLISDTSLVVCTEYRVCSLPWCTWKLSLINFD